MTPEAFDFYLNDPVNTIIGDIVYDNDSAFNVVGVVHLDNDEAKKKIGMICTHVMSPEYELLITEKNCGQYLLSIFDMPGHTQAIWAKLSKEIEELKTKLRSV